MPAPKSLGFVVVAAAGTPQLISASQLLVGSIRIHARSSPSVANVGKVYIGQQGMNKGTGAGVYAIFDPETVENLQIGPLMDLALIYIDADNSGDGMLISYFDK